MQALPTIAGAIIEWKYHILGACPTYEANRPEMSAPEAIVCATLPALRAISVLGITRMTWSPCARRSGDERGDCPVHPQEDRTNCSFTDIQVQRPTGARRERDRERRTGPGIGQSTAVVVVVAMVAS